MSTHDPQEDSTRFNFWPSFSDMMLVIVLLFSALMAVTVVFWLEGEKELKEGNEKLSKENEKLSKEVGALKDSIKALSKKMRKKGARDCLEDSKGKTVSWFDIEIHPDHPDHPGELHIRVCQMEKSVDLIDKDEIELAHPLLNRWLSIEDFNRYGGSIHRYSIDKGCRYHAITSTWRPRNSTKHYPDVPEVKNLIAEYFYPAGKDKQYKYTDKEICGRGEGYSR